MAELYKGQAGSPITYLTADISANQTTISIADDSALPDAPNICTIGYGENLETIKYETKSNGVLQNVTRGIEGTPRAWPAGTEVARFFTAYDHNAIIENFNSHLADNVTQGKSPHGIIYEFGTWTPSYSKGAHTYQRQIGDYVRYNNLVIANFAIILEAKDATASGGVEITGLPFSPSQIDVPVTIGIVRGYDLGDGYRVAGNSATNTSNIRLWKTNEIGYSLINYSAINDTALILGSFAYPIN
jgi:hypothetical protein